MSGPAQQAGADIGVMAVALPAVLYLAGCGLRREPGRRRHWRASPGTSRLATSAMASARSTTTKIHFRNKPVPDTERRLWPALRARGHLKAQPLDRLRPGRRPASDANAVTGHG
jgi:hypothetical protein